MTFNEATPLGLIIIVGVVFFLWKEKKKEKQKAVDKYIADRYHNNNSYEEGKREKDKSSPGSEYLIKRNINELLKKYGDLIACLVFVGRADGQLQEKECDVIRSIIHTLPGYKDFQGYEISLGFRDIKIKPELFESLVEKIAADEKKFSILKAGTMQIIGTQKTTQAGELYCLNFINNCSAVATHDWPRKKMEPRLDPDEGSDQRQVYVIK